MNRRRFLQSALSSLFMPLAVPAARAAPGAALPAADRVFYDDRFADARRLAERLATPARLVPVQGDITDLWNAELGQALTRSPLVLRGVTTESFHFCLNVMAASRTRVESSVQRIGRDLFLWTLRTTGGLSA